MHLQPHGVFSIIEWLKKRKLGPGLLVALHVMQVPRNGQLQHYNPFLWQPWNVQLKENHHNGKNFEQYTWYYSFIKRKKWPIVQLFTDSCIVANGVAILSATCNDPDWEIGKIDIWGRSVWIHISKWTEDEKIFLSHRYVHQNGTPTEEEFNNQVDKMTHSVDS